MYKVIWPKEDNQYVGLCKDFPSLSWLADSKEDALKGIKKVVKEVREDIESDTMGWVSRGLS